jgi:HSP20 family protein
MFAIGNMIPWRSKETGNDDGGTDTAITRFHSEIDRLFDHFFSEPFFGSGSIAAVPSWGSGWSPSIDVRENERELTVKAELPGIDPDDLDISVSGDVLTISGQKREESEERGEGYYHSERRFGSFRRSVPLPVAVDQEKISAEYERGVLTINLPKSEKAVAKRIPVSSKGK